MDNFRLYFPIDSYPFSMKHGDQLLFLGSCFSDEIALKARYCGFKCESNPFGTIFHPLVLSRFITETLEPKFSAERIVSRNDLYFTWDAGSSVFAFDSESLNLKLESIRNAWKNHLQQASILFVTFGSAWGYRIPDRDLIVANCHKFPASSFQKELSDSLTIVRQWKETIARLKDYNPALKIVFTVSPVRHFRDGLIENNQSKSILIDAVRVLVQEENCSYFPAYEIVTDELRDYRFFKTDRVHPNEEAIDYVWNRLLTTMSSTETQSICKMVVKQRLAENHRTLFPESEESINHLNITTENRRKLLNQFPEIQLNDSN